jgi:hypothetical protein
MHVGVTIVLAAVLGAAATWLWMSNGQPVADGTPARGSAVEQTPAPIAARSEMASSSLRYSDETKSNGSTDDVPQNGARASNAVPHLAGADGGSRDDSTYYRMQAIAQSMPDAADISGHLASIHETFALSPDDPEWGRRTEQALWEFFRARATESRLKITSISCRAAGCEVQALGEGVDPRTAPPGEGGPPSPPAPLRENRPVGESLNQRTLLTLYLGDGNGYIATYRREGPKPESTSP